MAEEIESLVNDISKKIELLTPEGRKSWEDKKDWLEEELKEAVRRHFVFKRNVDFKVDQFAEDERYDRERLREGGLSSEEYDMKNMNRATEREIIRSMRVDVRRSLHARHDKQNELKEHLKIRQNPMDADKYILFLIDEKVAMMT